MLAQTVTLHPFFTDECKVRLMGNVALVVNYLFYQEFYGGRFYFVLVLVNVCAMFFWS
jgi:hypothetical protein